MKNIDEKILMAEEEIKQLQNKRKKLISQQKQEERKKRDRRIYEKGGVFESIFTESKDFTKDEFYQLITFPNIKEEVNQKILKIIEKRGQGVYSCGNVPSFRRNGYRCSGRSIPSDRNRIPPASFWLVRVYSLNAGSSPYTSLMDL